MIAPVDKLEELAEEGIEVEVEVEVAVDVREVVDVEFKMQAPVSDSVELGMQAQSAMVPSVGPELF